MYLRDFKFWADQQWRPDEGKLRYGTELFHKLNPAWISCLNAGGIKEGATFEVLTAAIEKELLITRPALRRRSDFMATKANKGEELKCFIECIIMAAELAYLVEALSKNDLIILESRFWRNSTPQRDVH